MMSCCGCGCVCCFGCAACRGDGCAFFFKFLYLSTGIGTGTAARPGPGTGTGTFLGSFLQEVLVEVAFSKGEGYGENSTALFIVAGCFFGVLGSLTGSACETKGCVLVVTTSKASPHSMAVVVDLTTLLLLCLKPALPNRGLASAMPR